MDPVKFIVGVALTAASFIPGIGTVISAVSRLAGLSLISGGVFGQRGLSARHEVMQVGRGSTDSPLPIIYGTTRIGGLIG